MVHLVERRTFFGMERAAKAAGFSTRHFRRLCDDHGIPIIAFPVSESKKDFVHFVLGRDLEAWLNGKRWKTVHS